MTAAGGPAALARAIWTDALARIDPAAQVRACAADIAWRGDPVIAVAAGKAARRSLVGFADAVGERLSRAVCVVPARRRSVGAGGPDAGGADSPDGPADFEARAGLPPGTVVLEASHPVPDLRSLAAAEAVLTVVRAAPPGSEVAALISGGASALVALPAPGLTLADKAGAIAALNRAGADIHALNTVRRHLSAIKGGRLAAACPVPVTTLVLSDVVGDDLSVVGSGPTIPDPTTFGHACAVIARHIGWAAVSPAVRRHLDAGVERETQKNNTNQEDTVSPRDARALDRWLLAASVDALVDAAVAAADALGVTARVFARGATGDVADLARRVAAQAHRVHAARAAAGRPSGGSAGRRCWVGAGEPTVELPARPGVGGRAQQLALLVARELAGLDGVAVLVAGSDGIDGTSHAAGAVVDGDTWDAIVRAGRDPARALARCDATPALDAAGALIVTGPTGANQADLILVVG